MKATLGILFLTLLVCDFVLAKNHALVIGGTASEQQTKSHEFSRSVACAALGLEKKQYEVTTLFGSSGKRPQGMQQLGSKLEQLLAKKGVKSTRAASETEKYAKDYAFMKEEVHSKGAATPDAIDKYFEKLMLQVKPGDKVEIAVFAHGFSKCRSTTEFGPSDDLSEDCHHEIQIEDADGNMVRYNTEKLYGYLKQLEDKGALPNLVIGSCFSGRSKRFAKGLKQSCVFTVASGDSPGYACFEDDPDNSRDFTSTGEMVAIRYCKDQLEELKQKPFFKESKCFSKISQHLKEHQDIELSSIHSSYWSGRRWDEALHEPALNTTLGFRYFTQGNFSSSMYSHGSAARTESAMAGLDEISNRFKDHSEVKQKRALLEKAFIDYNQALSEEKAAIKATAKRNPTDSEVENIIKLQQKVKALAPQLVKRERELVDVLRRLAGDFVGTENNNACMRSL